MNLTTSAGHEPPIKASAALPSHQKIEKDSKDNFSLLGKIIPGLLSQVVQQAVQYGQLADSWYAGRIVRWVTQANAKTSKANEAALKALGNPGNTIHDSIQQYIQKSVEELAQDATVKKYLRSDNGKENINTIKSLVTAAVTNLMKAADSHKLKKDPKAQKPETLAELQTDLINYFASLLEKHDILKAVKSPETENNILKNAYASLSSQLIDEIYKVILPEGLKSAGLGYIASYLDGIIRKTIGNLVGDFLDAYLEPFKVAQERKNMLQNNPDGKLILELIDQTVQFLSVKQPLFNTLGAYGPYAAESFVTKILINLAHNDKVNPLQSAIKHLQSAVTTFYLENNGKLKASYEEMLKIQNELKSIKPVNPQAAHHQKELQERLKVLSDERKAQFTPLVDRLVQSAVGNDRLLKLFAPQAKQALLDLLCSNLDTTIQENPALLQWMAPQDLNKRLAQEMSKQAGANQAFPAIAKGLARLLTAPLPQIINREKERIADFILQSVPSLPLTEACKKHLKDLLVKQLEDLAKNPDSENSLWQFVQANIEGIALEIAKTAEQHPDHMVLIQAVANLTSDSKPGDVIKSITALSEPVQKQIQEFQSNPKLMKEAREAKAKLQLMAEKMEDFPNDQSLPQVYRHLENEYAGLFWSTTLSIVKSTGLEKIFIHGRLGLDIVERTLMTHLLRVVAKFVIPDVEKAFKDGDSIDDKHAASLETGRPQPSLNLGIDKKQLLELLTHLASLIDKHKNTFFDQLAAIESEQTQSTEKHKKLAALFTPLVEELYKHPETAKLIGPLVARISQQVSPGQSAGIISTAVSAAGKELHSMLPHILATLYPLLFGSIKNYEARKKELGQTPEGQLLLSGVSLGTSKLLQPLLISMMQSVTDNKEKNFKGDPILKNLEGLGSYLSEMLVTKLILNLSKDKPEAPLQGMLDTLKKLFGDFYKNDKGHFKKLQKEHLRLTKELEELESSLAKESVEKDVKEHAAKELHGAQPQLIKAKQELLKQLEKNKNERAAAMAPLFESIWKAAALDNEPPISLIPEIAKQAVPALLSEQLGALVLSQPGIISWLNPEEESQALEKSLAALPNGDLCQPLAIAISSVATAPLVEFLINEKLAIAKNIVASIAPTLNFNEAQKAVLEKAIASQLEEMAGVKDREAIEKHPLWSFVRAHAENAILEALHAAAQDNAAVKESVSKEAPELPQAFFHALSSDNPQDVTNPLLALARKVLDTVIGKSEKLVEAYRSYDKARKAFDQLDALPKPPADQKMFNEAHATFLLAQVRFHFLLKPAVDDIITASGLSKMLEKEGKLAVFGLDEIIRKNIYRFADQIFEQAINPMNQHEKIRANLREVLHDPQHAAAILKTKDPQLAVLGVAASGANAAHQEEILQKAGTAEAARVVELHADLLGHVIEKALQDFLKNNGKLVAEELNKAVLDNRFGQDPQLELVGDAIRTLGSGSDNRTSQELYKYIHAVLTPAISKGLINLLKNTPKLVPPPPGQHAMAMMPINIVTELFTQSEKELDTITKSDLFIKLKKEIVEKERAIKEQSQVLHKLEADLKDMEAAPKAAAADVKAGSENIETQVKAAKDELNKLKAERQQLENRIASLFKPLTAGFLASTGGNIKNDVRDPAHPLHDFQLLPDKVKNDLWNKTITDCLNNLLWSHYNAMHPDTEGLEKELEAAAGNSNVMVEFCKAIGVIIRDATPAALAENPVQISKNLVAAIQTGLKQLGEKPGSPEYLKQLQAAFKNHDGTMQQLIGSFLEALGKSKFDIFRNKLWPALQNLSYPVLLQLMTKMMSKLSAIDKGNDGKKNRTKIAQRLLELLNKGAGITNEAAEKMGKNHPYEVPPEQMRDYIRGKDQLHTLLGQVANAPHDEQALKKQYYKEFIKELFELIKFDKDDLPFPDAEKELVFNLIQNEVGPLVLDLSFNAVGSKGFLNILDDNLFHVIEIAIFQPLIESLDSSGKRGAATLDNLRLMIQRVASQPTSEEEAKLDRAFGDLIKNLIRDRFPNDPIVREHLLIKELLKMSGSDLGATFREQWCNNDGAIVKVITWLAGILAASFIPGSKYENGKLQLSPNPAFNMAKSTPEQLEARANQARELGQEFGEKLIIGKVVKWYEGIIDTIASWLNSDLKRIHKNSPKAKEAVKNLVWYVAWGLFYLVTLGGLISLIVKQFIRWRVAVNLKDLHENLRRPDNINLVLHFADALIGREQRNVVAPNPAKKAADEAAAVKGRVAS